MTLNYRVAGLIIAGLVLLSSSAPPARAAQTFHFSLPSIQMFEAPYLVAAEKGYFSDEGLDVQFTVANGGVATPALISGSLDATASSAAALAAIMKGAPLRIVLVQQSRPVFQLWSTRPEIKTLQDLRGKQISISTRGGSDEIAARIAFQAAGMSPDDVGYVPLGTGNSASGMTGQIPAFVVSTADISMFKTNGVLSKAHLVLDYAKVAQMPINGLAVAQKLITDNPDMLRRLLRAIVKGLMYTRAYKQQTIAILIKSKATSSAEAQSIDYDQYLASLAPRLEVSNEVARADLDVHTALLSMTKDKVPPLDAIYNFAPLRQAEADVAASGWKPKL